MGDPSPTVWRAVRRELESAGPAARRALRDAVRDEQPGVRARARALLLDERRRRVVGRLIGLAARGPIDLERGFWLLSRLEDPGLDARPWRLALDAMGAEVRRRAAQLPAGLDRARVLSEYLGGELGFAGRPIDYYHPDNVFLHRALTRRAGLPLTLCAIYLFVARRAGLRAAVVPLPGHVMLRVHTATRSLLLDPFHRGEERSHRECLEYLAQHGLSYQAAWFRDADDAAMLQRHVLNLKGSLLRRGRRREARRLDRVALALERAPRRSRARSRS